METRIVAQKLMNEPLLKRLKKRHLLVLQDPLLAVLQGSMYILLTLLLKQDDYGQIRAMLGIAGTSCSLSLLGLLPSLARYIREEDTESKTLGEASRAHLLIRSLPVASLIAFTFILLSLNGYSGDWSTQAILSMILVMQYVEFTMQNIADCFLVVKERYAAGLIVAILPVVIKLIGIGILTVVGKLGLISVLVCLLIASLLSISCIVSVLLFLSRSFRIQLWVVWSDTCKGRYIKSLVSEVQREWKNWHVVTGLALTTIYWTLPLYLLSTRSPLEDAASWANSAMVASLIALPVSSYYGRLLTFGDYTDDFRHILKNKGRSIASLLTANVLIAVLARWALSLVDTSLYSRLGIQADLLFAFILILPITIYLKLVMIVMAKERYRAQSTEVALVAVISFTLMIASYGKSLSLQSIFLSLVLSTVASSAYATFVVHRLRPRD